MLSSNIVIQLGIISNVLELIDFSLGYQMDGIDAWPLVGLIRRLICIEN